MVVTLCVLGVAFVFVVLLFHCNKGVQKNTNKIYETPETNVVNIPSKLH